MPRSLFPGCLEPERGAMGTILASLAHWALSLYLGISPQWAPGPENSYLAEQDPLKWPFLDRAAIQAGWEYTKERGIQKYGWEYTKERTRALDRQFKGREDRCMKDSNCASFQK